MKLINAVQTATVSSTSASVRPEDTNNPRRPGGQGGGDYDGHDRGDHDEEEVPKKEEPRKQRKTPPGGGGGGGPGKPDESASDFESSDDGNGREGGKAKREKI